MNIYKNFLLKKEFDRLKDIIMSVNFPWYFNEYVNHENEKGNNFQFTYLFCDRGKKNCIEQHFQLIEPVLKKVNFKKLNRIKANLLTRTSKIIEYGYHTDVREKGTTGILYLDNSNGYTKFKNGKKIKSEENKFVEFKSTLKHTGSSCTDQKRRVVINFNYQ